MKTFLLSLILAGSTQVNAAQVELGKYKALDVSTKKIHASFELRADGTVNFKVATPEFTMPEPGCEGKYKIKGHELMANLKCPTDLIPQTSVTIDITDINQDNLRSKTGVSVDVYIDALGEEATKFLLKKND